jgi:hypothetical protein
MFSLDGFSLRSILPIVFGVGVASLRFRTSLFKHLRLTLRAFARRIRRRIALGKCTRDQQQRRDCGGDQQAHGRILLLAGQSNPEDPKLSMHCTSFPKRLERQAQQLVQNRLSHRDSGDGIYWTDQAAVDGDGWGEMAA